MQVDAIGGTLEVAPGVLDVLSLKTVPLTTPWEEDLLLEKDVHTILGEGTCGQLAEEAYEDNLHKTSVPVGLYAKTICNFSSFHEYYHALMRVITFGCSCAGFDGFRKGT